VPIHGNPETAAVWNRFAPLLDRGPVVRLSPPGFGAPVRPRFTATVEEYRRWLVTELERFEQPVHLVGHDWGGAHVVNVAMTRPELLRSWVCDVIGLFDQGYRWHGRAQVWATPGAGEDAIAAMIDPPVTERAAALVKKGMHQDVALPVAEGQNADMGECILRLYRDAAQPAMAELGRNLERAAARPGLSIIATEDHLAAPTSSGAAQARAQALRSQSSTDWATGGSRKTHNGAPRPSTTSGQEWDESDTQKTSIVRTYATR
jgi:pimeloyl-ACP methyl ester carboxylesterase